MIAVLRMDHSVTGVAVNMLAAGLSFYLFRSFYGASGDVTPFVGTFGRLRVPFLSNIPYLGEVLFSQHALTYLAYALAILVWFFLFKTKFGLILRFAGENPRTVDTKGISVSAVQFLSLAFAGVMYGIAGAFLPLVATGLFMPGISAGRGWIAVALVSFGRFRPLPIVLGALFFGFLEALQLQVQALGIHFPHQIMLALPYIATILVLVVGGRGVRAPLHLGIPYHRE
jgi:simple sugar transport system permease protein